jgi:hypothetical protein
MDTIATDMFASQQATDRQPLKRRVPNTLRPSDQVTALRWLGYLLESICREIELRSGAQMATLFFSYSHQDEPLRDQLETHLAMLKRQGFIETWHDRRITAGEPVDATINANLDKTDVVLLLLSPDFLASDWQFSRRASTLHKFV